MEGNRQKCIDMWQWIVDNPGSSKRDWCVRHPELAEEVDDYCDCYACKENDERQGGGDEFYECTHCPVHWTDRGSGDCLATESPYEDWEFEDYPQNHAMRVLQIIKNTWNEDICKKDTWK